MTPRSHATPTAGRSPRISVVVPLLNEEGNVGPLVEAVRDALHDAPPWELILVDDGSTDGTPAAIRRATAEDGRVRSLTLARRYGQSTAIQAGFDHAMGNVIVTLDGDLQNDPADIPAFLEELERGFDLVAGYRARRKDPFLTRRLPSWVANRLIRSITGVNIQDNGCTLRAYRKELISRMRLYSEMHRFVPALAAGVAGARISEMRARHHPRLRGRSKYGLMRILQVPADLLTIKMIRSFRTRPLAMFAPIAGASVAAASLSIVAAVVTSVPFQPSGERSVVFLGVAMTWLALAVFILMVGLVGEVAMRHRGGRTIPLYGNRPRV